MKNILPLYLILSSFISLAQNPKIDSLQHALKNYDAHKLELNQNLLPDESDTTRVNILNSLSWEFNIVSDFVAAKKYADDAFAIAQQIGFKKGIEKSYTNISSIYYSQGNYSESLKNQFAALKISEETGDKKGIATSYGNIGTAYWTMGNYPEALKYQFASLKLKEETGDKKGIANSYNKIGLVYWSQGKHSEALKYYFDALKIFEEIGNKYGTGMVYNNIGLIYIEQKNYPEALKNLFTSLKLSEEIGDKRGIANNYGGLGETYYAQGNYSEALRIYFSALKINEEIGDKSGIATSYLDVGETKIKMQAAKEGLNWLMKGFKLAKEVKSISLMRDAYAALAEADSALGNYKGAYEHHKLFVQYRDSLVNEENTKKTTQQQMQYEFDKKETETKVLTDAELKKQKLVRNGFVGGFAVVLLFAGVFFRQRNKTQKEKLKAEEERKRSEDLLLNILPVDIAEEIKTTGRAKAKAYTMATVMFTDFKDFTTVSEKISAELLVDEIHTCFSAFDNILHKYRIEKIKTIGDAYLCASGLPVSNYTHAMDMLNAAFEIRNFIQQRKKEKEAKGEIPFELRIGIHTGPVVAGVVGVKKYAYDIWGDTVNIAARIEQNSESGKINISGSTYELVKDKFSCEHRGKIQAKNKGEIDMYFVELN